MAQLNTGELQTIVDKSTQGTHWKKFKQFGAQNQIVFSVGHFSPEIKMDKTLVGGGLIAGGPAPTMATGVKYSKEMTRGNLKDFYSSMKSMAAGGYLPGYTVESIEKLRTENNKSHPEEFDMVADIVILKCHDEKFAKQVATNQQQISEGNIIGAQVPGMPDGTSISDVFNMKEVRAKLTKEQLAQFEKFETKAQQAQVDMKPAIDKAGLIHKTGKLFGHEVTYLQKDGKKFYLALRVKNFSISGSLLYSFDSLPDGNTPCESVSQFSSKKVTERVEGETYERTEVSPKKSTIGAEGFLNRNEVEDIFKKIIKEL